VYIFCLQILSDKNKEIIKKINIKNNNSKDFLILLLSNNKKEKIEIINPINNVAELFKKHITINDIKKKFFIKKILFSLNKNKQNKINGTAVMAK
jgi:hypothetical protein